MGYGSRLRRYALIRDNGKTYFAWHIHHAVFDGFTMPLVMSTLYAAYFGAELPKLEPYARFVKYIISIDQDTAAKYWKDQLLDAKRSSFPSC